MKEVILLRFGEMFLKGKNYSFFAKTLYNNIKNAIKKYDCKIEKIAGRYLVTDFNDFNKDEVISALTKIFGLVSLSVATEVDSTEEAIIDFCKNIVINKSSFKVDVKRADKRFPIKSYEFASKLGGVILANNKGLKVDVHSPEEVVSIDIRESGKTYISYDKIACAGGMPIGTAGKSMLLLSGGIDSPVACYQMAKRGLNINAIHFHSYPYTSEQAKDKVISLAKLLTPYCGHINLYIVPFTKIQENIHKLCDDEYMVILVRRFMMDIAERVANMSGCTSLITGESLGQVASQTVESITATNNAVKLLPVFRPLIGMDKSEIMEISKNIGTYETSILPYEDCCSVFLPDSPVTKPKLDRIERNEKLLDREALISEAIQNIDIMKIY